MKNGYCPGLDDICDNEEECIYCETWIKLCESLKEEIENEMQKFGDKRESILWQGFSGNSDW